MSEIFGWKCDECNTFGIGKPMVDVKGRARVRGPERWVSMWDKDTVLHFCSSGCMMDWEDRR